MNTDAGMAGERPLNGAAKAGLVLGAGATILLFYLFATVTLLALAVLILFELLLLLVLLRFGLASLMTQLVERHARLIVLSVRSLWLRKGVDYHLTLPPGDAPKLFEILKRLSQKLAVAVPQEVSLEMSVNAWVRLGGFRRGSGKTKLGIGYDLMAGLTESELEAVLAHEMAHAKLVRRGYKRWLSSGLARAGNLTNALSAQVEAYRRAEQSFELAQMFLHAADALTRLAARLVSAYSRQDEFEADRGAAELCGAAPIRAALMKLDPLAHLTARLPWRERMAQLQLGDGFSQWLVKELAVENHVPEPAAEIPFFNKYSTHPSLVDRLTALPLTPEAGELKSAPAIGLLANPDAVAEKLMVEIQRVLAEEEKKDSKELQRWVNKQQRATHVRPLTVVGFILIIAALGVAVYLACVGISPGPVVVSVGMFTGGIWVCRLGGYRDRRLLPVPDYELLKRGWESMKDIKSALAPQKEIETAMRGQFGNEPKLRLRGERYLAESYEALNQCEYVRAHVAARLCLEGNQKSTEAWLALAVASAGLQQVDQSVRAINFVHRSVGLKTPATVWGAAWTFLLLGEWARAEGFLEKALKDRPDEPTFLTLRALCQLRRNKLQGAILSARQACTPAPRNKEHARLLIDLLLNGGYLREARTRLFELEAATAHDHELMFAFVRLHLLQRNIDAADQWTEKLKAASPGANMLVRLGHIYEAARKGEKAAVLYQQGLEAAHFPAAYLGLARLAAEAQHKDQARGYNLQALDLKKTPGKDAVGPLPLFGQAITQLLALEEPSLNCQAWLAAFLANASPSALANQSLIIFAPTQTEAEQYLETLLKAMQPGSPPPSPGSIQWSMASRQQQPEGPVRPGVQYVLS